MNRYLLLFFFSVLFISLSAQVRTEKEIKKLIKSGPNTNALHDGAYQFNAFSQKKATSLKHTKAKDFSLNEIESALLDNYDDVIICEALPKGYFVIMDGAIGLYNLNGDIIVPPVTGYPRMMTGTGMIYFGDSAPISDWRTYITNARGKARRAYSGSFSVVIDKESLQPIIPLGEYDEIHFTMKGLSTYYYVANLENEVLKWGVCDKKGSVVVPCQYSYVGLVKGDFAGDNSKNMEAVMASLNKVLKRRQYNNEHQWETLGNAIMTAASAIASAASAVGDAIIAIDDAMQKSGTYEALGQLAAYYGGASNTYDPSYATTSSNYTPQQQSSSSSVKQTPKYNISDQQNYNTDKLTYKHCHDLLADHFAGNRPASASDVMQWKQQMKNIRLKWEAKGKTIQRSQYDK